MAGILCVQINSKLNDKAANLNKIAGFIEANKTNKLDLIVLPEFFVTNVDYLNNFEPENGGDTVEFIKNLAVKYNTNIIAGSIVRKKADGLYNSAFVINRKGEVIAIYDKIHLFNYFGGTEGVHTNRGNSICCVDLDFGRVGVAVCFDIRYPMFFNQLLKENIEMIVLPACWMVPDKINNSKEKLEKVQSMWRALCKTRAYDNVCYFVVCNQVGDSGMGFTGIGNSMIISPGGEIIKNALDSESAIFADIDMEQVKRKRAQFPVPDVYMQYED